MKITNQELAGFLLRELTRRIGHAPDLADVEFVQCEDAGDGPHIMGYFDDADGSCTPIVFPKPPLFDPREVAVIMLRGFEPQTLH